MLIRIFAFLLEMVFFVFIAAALLRCWMNWLRINMRGQPGTFVMTVTDWLVKPLRRALPRSVAQSKVDWASLVAAGVLALVYALIWGLLFGLLLGNTPGLASAGFLTLLMFAVKMLVRVALQTTFMLVLGYAIISWVQPGSAAYVLFGRLTEPLLLPLRRVIPPIGGLDLSALILLVLIQIALMVLG